MAAHKLARVIKNVFISYRHDDTAGHAGRLSDRLVARLGAERVFMDVADIQPGQNFVSAIEETVDRCDCVLAVVGPRWLSNLKEREARGEDFVRSEIGRAMARGITVIPVLVGGGTMPSGDQLPAELVAFSRCEAVDIRDDHFDDDAARLINFLVGGRRGSYLSYGQDLVHWPIVLGLTFAAIAFAAWFVWRTPARAPALASVPSTPTAAPSRALPNLTYGAWTLRSARDDEGNIWSNSVLQFTEQKEVGDGLTLQGQFTWRLDNRLVGTEEVSGHYVERTRQVTLVGTRVTDAPHDGPRQLAMGSYSAILADDDRELIKGRWGSTGNGEPGSAGEWHAVR
jgi:hypothetical protein